MRTAAAPQGGRPERVPSCSTASCRVTTPASDRAEYMNDLPGSWRVSRATRIRTRSWALGRGRQDLQARNSGTMRKPALASVRPATQTMEDQKPCRGVPTTHALATAIPSATQGLYWKIVTRSHQCHHADNYFLMSSGQTCPKSKAANLAQEPVANWPETQTSHVERRASLCSFGKRNLPRKFRRLYATLHR